MSRVITALVVLPVLIASLWFERLAFVFYALALAALFLGLAEFYQLARRNEASIVRPAAWIGYAVAAVIAACFYYARFDLILVALVVLTIGALVWTVWQERLLETVMGSVGATVFGVMYVAVLGGHLIAVRANFDNTLAAKLLSFFFLVLMGSDTAAYYGGRAFGRRKLAPQISPGKSWEGAAYGFVASLVAAALAHVWFFPELNVFVALLLAGVMNVLGVAGDLCESALKRGAGAKDAANVLPGHGGFLDRLDSLLFNAPLIYYFAHYYFR